MIKNGFSIADIEQKADEIGTEIEVLKSQLKLHEQQAKPLRQDDSRLNAILAEISSTNLDLAVYDDALVRRQVESVKVVSADKIVVRLACGAELEESL